MLVFALAVPLNAQELLPCFEREHFRDDPWTDGAKWCLEEVINDPSHGALGFTALAVASDGTLYAARPLYGEIYAFSDELDDDLLPDTPHLVASGLTLPNGLAWHDGALYISGGANLYRLRDGELETLVDDLPSGEGFWTGDLTIGPDERLYVATGAPCDACAPDDPMRGAILSFDLDGGNRQLVATGLRQPFGLAFFGGDLWTVDTARDGLDDAPMLDELNRVRWGAHFGWPFCVGSDNTPDLEGEFDCADAMPPALVFPTHSTPTGLAAYTSDALPQLQDTLLVVLSGSNNEAHMEGYALASVRFDADGNPSGYDLIIPGQPDDADQTFSLQQLNYRGSGIWPRHPLDVAVSPQGWVYLSRGDGLIFALRPL